MATKKKSPKKKASKKKAPKKKAPKKKKPATKRPAKKSAKKAASKKSAPKKKSSPKGKQPGPLGPPEVEGTLLGRIDDFFAHINVIALTLKSPLSVGNTIHIKGYTTDLKEPVASIQIEHESVQTGKKGDSVGIKISGVARKRDWVFRVD
jgi:hypothetical protein